MAQLDQVTHVGEAALAPTHARECATIANAANNAIAAATTTVTLLLVLPRNKCIPNQAWFLKRNPKHDPKRNPKQAMNPKRSEANPKQAMSLKQIPKRRSEQTM